MMTLYDQSYPILAAQKVHCMNAQKVHCVYGFSCFSSTSVLGFSSTSVLSVYFVGQAFGLRQKKLETVFMQ